VSIHLLEQAALLKLQPSTKLAFMAFCDSADKETGIAFPGMDQVITWSGVGKSRVHEIITELIEAGLLERLSSGHRGRRAEYRVFVKVACCALHAPFGQPEEGSAPPDPKKASAGPDPNVPDDVQTGDWVRKGSGLGPVQGGPLPNSPTTTSTPSGVDAVELPLDGVAPSRTRPMSMNQRANAITARYTELVPLSNFPAIAGIVRKALNAKAPDGLSPRYFDDEIGDALVRLANEGRPVTVDTLRIELDGITPLRRAAAGLATAPGDRVRANQAGLDALAAMEAHG
jgi:hypothetical protein